MIPDQAEASFWAAFLRNRNVDAGTAGDGAIPVAGGFAIYAGGTLLNRAYGAGSTRPLTADDLSVVEEFYGARGEPARFELGEETLARDGRLLRERGYDEEELRFVWLERAVGGSARVNGHAAVRTTSDRRRWSELSVRAHEPKSSDVARLRATLAAQAAAGAVLFIASLDGVDAGAAALATYAEIALLVGAAVLPDFRGRGIHRALIAARLAAADARGATRAALKTIPESPAERSAARFDFVRTGLRRLVRRDGG